MKIVISATGAGLEANVDPRFGRAAFLLVIDSETGALLEAIDNSEGRDAAQGAGIRAAALVADKGVQAILTGRVGPKAMPVVEKAGIQVVSDVSGTVQEALEEFRKGALASSATGSSSAGQGRGAGGCGCGRGKGGGQGRGQGQGRGKGQCRKK